MRFKSQITILKKSLGVFIMLFLLLNTANSQAHKVRMAMVGNSITYGALLSNPSTESYPGQLNIMLSEIYGDTCVIGNYGVSGRTLMRKGPAPIWIESAFATAIKSVPDICLIALGTNDSKPLLWADVGHTFATDYQAMIDTFNYRNPDTKFIICLPPPIWEGHPYSVSDPHNDGLFVSDVIPIIDSIAKANGATIIDFHTYFKDSVVYFPDNLHPNAAGSRIMAEILFDTIQKLDMIHQVEAGNAYVSTFKQAQSPAVIGGMVELSWTTIFADSVFLDGVLVDASGSKEVLVEDGKKYILKVKGANNTSEFELNLNAYVPEKTSMVITTSTRDYSDGIPVFLYVTYRDQNNKPMPSATANITWTVIDGEASLDSQTDTSIQFIPTSEGVIVVEAKDGDRVQEKTLKVNKLTSISNPETVNGIKAFPNPVKDKLYFEVGNLSLTNANIKVFNVLGEMLIDQNIENSDLNGSRFYLNTSSLDQGVFVYTIYFENETVSGQFVKSK